MKPEIIEKRDDCPRFNICDANLCPYDERIKDRTWYPDEAICGKSNMAQNIPG